MKTSKSMIPACLASFKAELAQLISEKAELHRAVKLVAHYASMLQLLDLSMSNSDAQMMLHSAAREIPKA